jgi:hypothetical protein
MIMAEVTIDFVAPWTKYVAERSPPRYDADCAQICYSKRVVGANTVFILKAVAQKYDIFTDDEDLIPTAVETRGDPAFDTTLAKDHDDDTAACYSLAPYASLPSVNWDLGDARERLLYIKAGGDVNMRTIVYISTDCTTETRLWDYYRTVAQCTYTTFRCVRITAYNGASYSQSFCLYTIEAYNPTAKKRLTIPVTSAKTVRAFVQSGYSQLLEVGEIWVD